MKTPPLLFTPYQAESDVYKIAVLRCNAIGDFIFSLPALDALDTAYPQAEIVLLGRKWHADFLRGRPGPVNRVEVIPPMEGLNIDFGQHEEPAEVEAFFDRMQAEDFDLAIQLHGGGQHSNPFTKRLGARMTIGARAPDAAPLDRWIPYTFHQIEILRQLEIVSLVGAQPISLEPHLHVTDNDLQEARELVAPSNVPLIVLHPGAVDPRRRWTAKQFAAVGDALAETGAMIVVVSSKDEQYLADEVVRLMKSDAINLGGKTTLGGLAGVLARAKLVISNDSGPLHMAIAVGTPTIGIYWIGNVVHYAPFWRNRHRIAVSWRFECPECNANYMQQCEHRESFVADILVTDILASAFDLLGQSQEKDELA